MFRTVLAAAALAVAATAASAQSDTVAARKALMERLGQQVDGTLRDMANGARPYDRAAVDAAFAQLGEAMEKLPALYAESTRDVAPSGRYSLSPRAWENKADFDAKFAGLAGAVAEARPLAADPQGIKEAHGVLRSSCSNCHRAYRVRN